MSATQIREAAETMRREDTPFFDAVAELLDEAAEFDMAKPDTYVQIRHGLISTAAEKYLDAYLEWPASVAPIEPGDHTTEGTD